jgi:DnaK suppressor protein
VKTIEDPEVVQAFETRMRNERAEIIRQIEESREHRAPVELDQQSVGRLSRMDAMQQQAMALDLTRRRQHRKVAIDKALTRVRNGEYGYCVGCGEAIAVRRLEVDPTFEVCVRCAS